MIKNLIIATGMIMVLIMMLISNCSFKGIRAEDVEYWPDGTVINAASGSPEDIRSALELANPGDTVKIPAGTFMFDSPVSTDAGVCITGSGRDETILQ